MSLNLQMDKVELRVAELSYQHKKKSLVITCSVNLSLLLVRLREKTMLYSD